MISGTFLFQADFPRVAFSCPVSNVPSDKANGFDFLKYKCVGKEILHASFEPHTALALASHGPLLPSTAQDDKTRGRP